MNKELHDKAWNLLEEKGLKIGERMMVRNNFLSACKEDYPFVSIKWEKGEVKYYHSEIPEIKSFMFQTEQEVILANAIYENVKDNFNINDFIQMLKYTFRIIGSKTEWA